MGACEWVGEVLVSMAVHKMECTCGMGVCGVRARAWGEALRAGRLRVSAGRECVECVRASVCVLCVRERRKRRKRAEQIETAMHVRVCMCGYDAERMRVCEAS